MTLAQWKTCCPPQATCREELTAPFRPDTNAGEAPLEEITLFNFNNQARTREQKARVPRPLPREGRARAQRLPRLPAQA